MLKIEKTYKNQFVEVRDPSIQIGDVVETTDGFIGLIVWSDNNGVPGHANPGSNGFMYLSNCQSCRDWTKFPKVRKVKATLYVEVDP